MLRRWRVKGAPSGLTLSPKVTTGQQTQVKVGGCRRQLAAQPQEMRPHRRSTGVFVSQTGVFVCRGTEDAHAASTATARGGRAAGNAAAAAAHRAGQLRAHLHVVIQALLQRAHALDLNTDLIEVLVALTAEVMAPAHHTSRTHTRRDVGTQQYACQHSEQARWNRTLTAHTRACNPWPAL